MRPPDVFQGRIFLKQLQGKNHLRVNRTKMTGQDIKLFAKGAHSGLLSKSTEEPGLGSQHEISKVR